MTGNKRQGRHSQAPIGVVGTIIAIVVFLSIPAFYSFTTCLGVRRNLTIESTFIAKMIERNVQARPEMWALETERLLEVASQQSATGEPEQRAIKDATGAVVAETGFKAPKPSILVSVPFFDSGRMVGSLEVRRSVQSQLKIALGCALFSLMLAGLIYLSFRRMRLEIEQREALLLRHHEELEETVAIRTRELLAANEGLKEAIRDADTARDAAEAASRAKSRFLANMSHEIRTPMNGVLGMADLLLNTTLSDQQRQFANTIRASGHSLLGVINDILDFSKIEAGKLGLVEADVDIRDVVEGVAEMLAEGAYKKGLELSCLVSEEIPARLRVDPDRLRQILVNLVGNAVKFTDVGEVAIRVAKMKEEGGRVVVRFEIRDTGIGVSPAARESIFDSFSQADSSTRRKHGGTGLGLAIAKQLVQMMAGAIGVESEESKGSTFWFTIPFKAGIDRKGEERDGTILRDAHVLIVDSNETNRAVLEHYLGLWGVRHESRADGPGALTRLRLAHDRGEPFHVTILDMAMPGMNGLELAKTIKADPSIRDTGIIMLTSAGSIEGAGERRETGIDIYLTKPVHQSKLFNGLASVLLSRPFNGQAAVDNPPNVPEGNDSFGARVLLVEDNVVNQKVGKAMLEHLGCVVDIAVDGVEAVEAVAQHSYDIVFMDCQMPRMDGYEATRAIREAERDSDDGRNRAVPIVALTAHAMEGDRALCIEAGMDGYLSKPFSQAQIRDVLTRWLEPRLKQG